jgi:hypothetical protein
MFTNHAGIKKLAIIGCTVAAIAGTGTAALAATSSSSATPTATANTTAGAKALAKRPGLARIRNLQHASWVTEDKKTSTVVTHDAIRGTVGAVSATSITVTSADKVSQTYTVDSATKVHTRATHKGAVIGDVKTGDEVIVAGTGTSNYLAAQIADVTK